MDMLELPQTLGFELIAHIPIHCQNVAIQGNWAYVAAGWDGILILDLSNPSSIREVGRLTSPNYVWDIAVDGEIVFVAEHPGEEGPNYHPGSVQWVDVSDRANPFEIGRYIAGDFVDDVCIHNHQLYILANWHPEPFTAKLLTLDANYSPNPTLIGQCDISRRGYQVVIQDTHAYVAAFDGLHVIDLIEPTNPRELHHVGTNLSLHAFGVDVADGYIYTAAYFQGLRILTAGAVAKPRCLSRKLVWGMADSIAIRGDVAYINDMWYGLWRLDVSDKQHPVETGCFAIEGTGYRHVTLTDSYVILSAGHDGLYVLRDQAGYRNKNLLRRPGLVVYYDDNIEWV